MTSAASRGRPPVAQVGELRARAIAVLERRGYSATTMGALADELGVSLRTLHRYFPAKADIVWGGLEGGVDALREGLEAAGTASLVEAVSAAMVGAFAREAEDADVARARLRLIALSPELRSTHPETYAGWREETIAFVARRMGLPVDAVQPRAVGAALQAAITEALEWWALRDDSSAPVEAVTSALGGFEDALRG